MEDVFKTTDEFNRHTEDGREILNPTPMQPPLNYKAQPSLAEQIRQQVRAYHSSLDMDPETEEEADDFDIEDDPQPVSRWENDLIPSIKETRARQRALQEKLALYAAAPNSNQERPSPVGDEQRPARALPTQPEPPAELSKTPHT